MRILHVTPYSAEAWAYGGIPRLTASLTRSLARQGHDVTVCTTDACDESARLPTGWRRTDDGVTVGVFRNLSNGLAYHAQLFLPQGLQAYLARAAGTFDVAHLHACRNIPGAMAAYYLRRARVPYLVAPNGTAPRLERRRLAKRIFDSVAGRRILDGASRILAVSAAEQRQLEALGVASSTIRYIPNPVDADEFNVPLSPGRFRQRFGVPPGPVVLYLGKLTPRKRVEDLIHAFAALRHAPASLVIAGNDMGSGHLARSLVRRLGLERRTIFTGLLRAGERLEALADADVLVYPSQDEIFGLVPVEALLAGTPVVVAGDSGCGEVIGAAGGGLVVPVGEPPALCRAIDEILSAPAHWRNAASSAAQRVRLLYGADRIGAQMTDLYREMALSA